MPSNENETNKVGGQQPIISTGRVTKRKKKEAVDVDAIVSALLEKYVEEPAQAKTLDEIIEVVYAQVTPTVFHKLQSILTSCYAAAKIRKENSFLQNVQPYQDPDKQQQERVRIRGLVQDFYEDIFSSDQVHAYSGVPLGADLDPRDYVLFYLFLAATSKRAAQDKALPLVIFSGETSTGKSSVLETLVGSRMKAIQITSQGMSSCGVFQASGDHTSYVYSDTLLGAILSSTLHYNFVLNLARNNVNSCKIVGRTINIEPAYLFIMTNDCPQTLLRHNLTGQLVTQEEMHCIIRRSEEDRDDSDDDGMGVPETANCFTLVRRKRITSLSVNQQKLDVTVRNNWRPFMARSVVMAFSGQAKLRSKAIFHEYVSPHSAIAAVYPIVLSAIEKLHGIALGRTLRMEHNSLLRTVMFSLIKTKHLYLDHVIMPGRLRSEELERLNAKLQNFCVTFGLLDLVVE